MICTCMQWRFQDLRMEGVHGPRTLICACTKYLCASPRWAQWLPFRYAFKPRLLYRALSFPSLSASALGWAGGSKTLLVLHSCPCTSLMLVVAKGVFEHPNHPPGYATGMCAVFQEWSISANPLSQWIYTVSVWTSFPIFVYPWWQNPFYSWSLMSCIVILFNPN